MKTFKRALQNNAFIVTADLSVDRRTGAEQILSQARLLSPSVDALQVPDSHDGRLQVSAAAVAGLLIQNGMDAVPHLTGRDRNRIALENDLLGLGVLGATSVLLTRGEELPKDYRPPTRHVLELSGEDLVTVARQLGEDESVPGAPEFLVGTAATVFNPKAEWKPRSLSLRVNAGAGFIQTQICFNMKALRRYMTHLVDARITWRCAIIASVAVLPDATSGRLLKEHLQGAVIPEKIIRRMEQAQVPEQEGIRVCVETIQKLREIPGISGINLMTPGDPATLIEVIRLAGLEPQSREALA